MWTYTLLVSRRTKGDKPNGCEVSVQIIWRGDFNGNTALRRLFSENLDGDNRQFLNTKSGQNTCQRGDVTLGLYGLQSANDSVSDVQSSLVQSTSVTVKYFMFRVSVLFFCPTISHEDRKKNDF